MSDAEAKAKGTEDHCGWPIPCFACSTPTPPFVLGCMRGVIKERARVVAHLREHAEAARSSMASDRENRERWDWIQAALDLEASKIEEDEG